MLDMKEMAIKEIGHMSIVEKIKLLSEEDKSYLQGYIDRALSEKNKSKAGVLSEYFEEKRD